MAGLRGGSDTGGYSGSLWRLTRSSAEAARRRALLVAAVVELHDSGEDLGELGRPDIDTAHRARSRPEGTQPATSLIAAAPQVALQGVGDGVLTHGLDLIC